MSDEDEVLEFGARRRHPTALRIGAALLLAAGLGGYLLVHGGGGPPSKTHAAPPPTPSSTAAPSSPVPSISARPILPPWPQRAGACGNTAFLPLVSSQPLSSRTGIRAVVGDRLATVDLDTGAVQPVAGLPRHQYSSELATADDGTYALLRPCAQTMGEPAQLVRIDGSGTIHPVSRGRYDYLLSGGRHPWALISDATGERSWLDPLDGGRRWLLPSDFSPIGAYRDLVVGEVNRPNADPNAPFMIRVIAPRTGRVRLDLGPATSVSLSRGVILWTGTDCTNCRLHRYDLTSGRSGITRRPIGRLGMAWGGAVSPDRRTAAFLRERATPARYEMDHPGNPNELVLVDLFSGAVRPVPKLELWSKSFPGLDFSADSRWLVISLDEGTGVRLLLWHPGLAEPLRSPARLTTRVAYHPDLATLG